ncbi:MAG: S24 family peptidase [Bauldia sp.]|nr:S24 family peptidase [Bauldia sp.]
MNLDPVRLKILKLMKERGTDLKNASVAIGRNAAYLHQFVYRGTPKVLTQEVREALAKELGCQAEELRHQRVPPRKPRSKSPSADERVRAVSEGGVPEGYSKVAEIDVRASAGPGAIHEGLEEVKHVWFFPENVIRHELRARTDDLRMITIDGDSMEPLLASGDRILIDTSQRIPAPPGIFVIWDGMGLVAKRIEHEPNSEPSKVMIKSVNPEYQAYEVGADEVQIIGRIIWTSRRL